MTLRLAFAAAVHVPADVYLLDEILAVGDQAFQEVCRSTIAQMRQRGAAAILVSHQLADLEQCCDRIMYLEEGGGLTSAAEKSISPLRRLVGDFTSE
jgi:ABC-2 type transport system ATP-binding protein